VISAAEKQAMLVEVRKAASSLDSGVIAKFKANDVNDLVNKIDARFDSIFQVQ
jgi:hypothetical protein